MNMTEITRNLLRIVVGLMFWQHGAQKLFGMFGATAVESWFAFPRGIAGILEFFGGLLIIFGLFTRPVAFLLSGQMAVAFFMAHFPQGFWPIANGGELAVLYSFTFLFIWATGGGDFSIDGLRKKKGEAGTQD